MSAASPLGGPIATAFAEITADTSSAEKTVENFIRGLGQVDKAAARAATGFDRSFQNAAQSAIKSIGGIAEGFVSTERSASNAARGILSSFTGIFSDVASAAGRAGLRVADALGDAVLSGIRTVTRSAGEILRTGLTAAATALGVGISVALTKGFQRLTTIQDATAALTISLGSAAEAADLLAGVLEVVRGTPFNLDQFARGAQLMSAMGIEAAKIPGILTAVGEAAATQGGRANEVADRLILAFSQVSTTGRIMGDDILAFSEAGVNALVILGNHFGVTAEEMRDMVSEGAVPAAEAIDVLARGIVEGTNGIAGATVALGGTMAQLRQTLTGALGGLGAAFARFGASIIEPFTEALVTAFSSSTDVIDELGERVGALADRIVASNFMATVIDVLERLPELIDPVIRGFSEFKEILVPLAGAGAGAALTAISTALGPIGALIPRISPIVGLLAGIIAISPQLREAFIDLAGRAVELGQSVLTQLKPVLDFIVPLIEHFGEVLIDSLGQALEAIAPLIAPVAELFAVLLSAVFRIIDPVVELATALISTFAPVIERLLPVLEDIVSILAGGLAHALEVLVGPITEVAEALADGLVQVIDELAPVLPDLATSVGELAVALAELLVALTPVLVPLIELSAAFIAENAVFFAETLERMVDVLVDILGPITSVVSAIADFVAANEPLQTAFEVLFRIISQIMFPLQSLPTVIGAVSTAGLFLWQNVLVPIGNFFQTVFTTAVNFVVTAFGSLISVFQTLAGIALTLWQTVLVPLGNFLATVFRPILLLIIGAVAGPMLTAIGALISIFIVLWQNVLVPLWGFLSRNFMPVLRTVAGFMSGALSVAIGVVTSVLGFLYRNVFQPVASFLSGVFNVAIGAFKRAWDLARSAISTISGVLSSFYNSVIRPAATFIRDTFVAAINRLKDAWRFLSGPINTAKNAIEGIIDVIQTAIGFIGDLIDKLSSIKLPDLSPGFDIPGVPLFQSGGIGNFGAGTPAILHGREAILPLDDVEQALKILSRTGLFQQPSLSSGGGNSFSNTVGDLNINVSVAGTGDADAIATATASAVDRVLERRGLEFTARTR